MLNWLSLCVSLTALGLSIYNFCQARRRKSGRKSGGSVIGGTPYIVGIGASDCRVSRETQARIADRIAKAMDQASRRNG